MLPAFRNLAALGVLLLLAACNLPSPEASPVLTAAPSGEPRLTETPARGGALSITEAAPTQAVPAEPSPPLSTLQNVRIELPDTGAVILQEGRFIAGETRVVLDEVAAEGNLGAAVVYVNLGGSGNFAYLLTFAVQEGRFVQQGAAVFLEDRPEIRSLKVAEGRILVDATVHWADEPFCCPTKHVLLTFLPTEWGTLLERVSTFTPEGTERRIALSAPANFAEVVAPVQVAGRVSVMPFENTLTYRYATPDGLKVLEEGGFMAQPDDPDTMGGAGSFSVALPAPPVPPYADVQLQILEISMRDGSVLAMDSVWLTVK